MQKIIEEIDKEKNSWRVTTPDDRHYTRATQDPKTGLPVFRYYPSVTWITHFDHKGEELLRYYGNRGYDEGKQLMHEAGDHGTRVHAVIADLLHGAEVEATAKYATRTNDVLTDLTVDDWECVYWFEKWFEEVKPVVLGSEYRVWSDEHDYAGTVDFLCKIGEDYWLIDFKTGQNLYPAYELQLAAYKRGIPDVPEIAEIMAGKELKLGILQLGYKRNKTQKFKFTEVADDFPGFLAVQNTWRRHTRDKKPLTRELPLRIKLNLLAPEGDTAEDEPENK